MKQLTIKELAPYLPYGLQIMNEQGTGVQTLNNQSISHIILYNRIHKIKPILRPLDLTKEIEHNGKRFVPVRYFEDNLGFCKEYHSYIFRLKNIEYFKINYLPLIIIQKILEWHFDIFGLLDKNLAVDINTVNG